MGLTQSKPAARSVDQHERAARTWRLGRAARERPGADPGARKLDDTDLIPVVIGHAPRIALAFGRVAGLRPVGRSEVGQLLDLLCTTSVVNSASRRTEMRERFAFERGHRPEAGYGLDAIEPAVPLAVLAIHP